MRAIYLPALNRSVSLGQYLKAIRLAKANPTARFDHGLTCWWPQTGTQIMRQFREGMHERISQAVPYGVRGAS